MKRTLLSLALALALCLGLSAPALAAEDRWWEYEDTDTRCYLNLLDSESMHMGEQTFRIRFWEFEELEDGNFSAALGGEAEEWTTDPILFPRGAEALFRDGLATDLFAYADPDKDGVYEQRLLHIRFVERGGELVQETSLVPMTETSVTSDGDNMYDNGWLISGGVDRLDAMEIAGGCVKLTAGRLTDLYGAGTLIEVAISSEVKENSAYSFMLTGETLAPEDTERLTYTVAAGGAVVSRWAADLVDQAYKQDLLPDCTWNVNAARTDPDYTRPITRAQFAGMTVYLYAAMQGKSPYDLDMNSKTPFTDTSDPMVGYAYNLGFAGGTGETAFSPDSTLTREQAAVMLSQVYARQHGAVPQTGSTGFADDGSVSSWAKSAVAFMADRGILSGVGDNRYAPRKSIAIQEAAIMALRMFENLK